MIVTPLLTKKAFSCILCWNVQDRPGVCKKCCCPSVVPTTIEIKKDCKEKQKEEKKEEKAWRFKTVDEILAQEVKTRKILGFEFLGDLPDHFGMVLFGKPGQGKSTLALKFADRLSRITGKTAYIALEESLETPTTLQNKLKLNKIESSPNLIISDNFPDEFVNVVRQEKIMNLFLDSVSMTSMRRDEAEELKNALPGVLFLITHSKKDKDDYIGDSWIGHLTDIVCNVSSGIAVPIKNRFAQVHNADYKIFGSGNR